ncbi:sortase [Nocardioides sp. BP30]|uniref:sortase n=1 Tax=Nocardioides sp. BP30 TaxID=3036374 RepID=UPI00246845B0|nr:sortase [Nocardioides sp. BP30]WGL53327.1 sortase [Nocardioides sp. BP30]
MSTAPAKAGAVLRRPLQRIERAWRSRGPVNTAAPADLRRAIPRPSDRTLIRVTGWTMAGVAALVLGFLLYLVVISPFAESRSQSMLFNQFRTELAAGTAPIGQVDVNGKLLKLGAPVATIAFPSLDEHYTVVEGTSSRALLDGPGHRRDTPLPGQQGTSVVYGRQAAYGGPFADLSKLHAGDRITTVTGQGTAQYQVIGLRRAGDRAPATTSATEGRLTLVFATGTPFMGASVSRIDAKLLGTAQPTPQPVLKLGSLTSAEDPLASDDSGWLPMSLLLELAVIAVVLILLALRRWGKWHTWIVGVPVLLLIGAELAKQVVVVLPNLY